METPYVYSDSETLINLDTVSNEDLISIESMDLVYAIRNKEVLIFRWTNRKYNQWEKIMGDRLIQI